MHIHSERILSGSSILLMALIWALPASGQAAEWYPLETGTVREYEVFTGRGLYYPTDLLHLYRQTVDGDTTLDGETFRRVRIEYFSPERHLDSTATCAMRYVPVTMKIEIIPLAGHRLPRGMDSLPQYQLPAGHTSTETIRIAGTAYTLHVHESLLPNSMRERLARGIGVLHVHQWSYSYCSNPNFVTAALTFASVGDVTYGRPMEDVPQFSELMPLEVGNYWLYQRQRPFHPHTPPYNPWVRLTVTGDTLIGGEAYYILRREGMDASHVVESSCEAAVRHQGQGLDVVEDQPCSLSFLTENIDRRSQNILHVQDGVVDIRAEAPCNCSPSETRYIGQVGMELDFWRSGGGGCGPSGPPVMFDLITLRHAHVNGVEWGQSPITIEDEGPHVLEQKAIYPNPARAEAVVRLNLASARRLVLEVFDLMGRRVLHRPLGTQSAGEVRIEVDLSEMAAGVYFVRLTSPDGIEFSSRVIRAP